VVLRRQARIKSYVHSQGGLQILGEDELGSTGRKGVGNH